MNRLASFLILVLVPFLLGMNKKAPYSISFHAQGSEMDPPKTIFPMNIEGRRMIFKVVPEISHQNVVAFHPFPGETDIGQGIALKLDFRGTGNLEILTRTRTGEYLVAMVNGRPVDFVAIDRPVTDGMITIWKGVPPEVIAAMDKEIPRIKAGSSPSSAEHMEMAPVTKEERKKAYEKHKAEERAAAKAKKEGRTTTPEVPSLQSGPVTSKIPVEGEAVPVTPLPGTPPLPSSPSGSEPPLPQR